MGALIFTLSFCFIYFLCFPNMITSQENCPNFQCSNGEPIVQFPFRVKDRQQERCGRRNYNLTCNSSNKTVLNLPNSGEFSVRNIDYLTREIQIHDPENCLPRRILNLSLSGSPFIGAFYRNFTFLNCSSVNPSINRSSTSFERISCLSSATHTVLVTNSSNLNITQMNSSCGLIASVSVPIRMSSFLSGVYNRLTDDLYLTWRALPSSPPPFNVLRRRRRGRLSKGAISGIVIGVGLPLVTGLIICLAAMIKGRRRGGSDDNPERRLREDGS